MPRRRQTNGARQPRAPRSWDLNAIPANQQTASIIRVDAVALNNGTAEWYALDLVLGTVAAIITLAVTQNGTIGVSTRPSNHDIPFYHDSQGTPALGGANFTLLKVKDLLAGTAADVGDFSELVAQAFAIFESRGHLITGSAANAYNFVYNQ